MNFLAAVLADKKVRGLLSDEHFSVDGTLLEGWASPKSFRPKDGSGDPPGPGRNSERSECVASPSHWRNTRRFAPLFCVTGLLSNS